MLETASDPLLTTEAASTPPRTSSFGRTLLGPAVSAAAALAVLPACGGSAPAGSEGTPSDPAASTWPGASPDPEILAEQVEEARALVSDGTLAPQTLPTRLSTRAATRFLGQCTFGATAQSIEALSTQWRKGWLQAEFERPAAPTHWERVTSRFSDWVAEDPGTRGGLTGGNTPGTILDWSVWEAYLTAPDQLRKRVGYAWSQILVVSANGLSGGGEPVRMRAAGYLDLLERHAFGRFRDLLEAVTLSPAMGMYLSHRGNRRAEYDASGLAIRVPDENYAREVMQLFTIGLYRLNQDGTRVIENGLPVEAYTQEDVTQLARVFTGWNDDRGVPFPERYRAPMTVDPALHAPEEKRFLGVAIPAGTGGVESLRRAMDALANHPNVGPFIGRQLIQRLVTSNPSPAYVARVAARFADNGRGERGDLRAVIGAVLMDAEATSPTRARSPEPTWGKLREPVLRLAAMARWLNVRSTVPIWRIGDQSNPATALGQSPLRSPSVFNFYRPGYVPPSSALAPLGLVAPELQTTTETSVVGIVNTLSRWLSTPPAGLQMDFSRLIDRAADPAALVALIDLELVAQSLTPASRRTIETALAAMPARTDAERLSRVRAAVLLVANAPEALVQK